MAKLGAGIPDGKAGGLLEGVRRAIGKSEQRPATAGALHGQGRHLGMPAKWRLLFRGDGAYLEEVITPHVAAVFGFEPTVSSFPWAEVCILAFAPSLVASASPLSPKGLTGELDCV